MQAPVRFDPPVAYSGDKGFRFLSPERLSRALADYKKLRDSARDDGTTAYARQAIREIRSEMARRLPSTDAA